MDWQSDLRQRLRGSDDSAYRAIEDRLRSERDQSGSRFYNQPGFAVLTGEAGLDPSGYDGDTGDALARVRSALGAELERDANLGIPSVGDAGYGRGASTWTAVIEWTGAAVASGVIGTLASEQLLAAARRYREIGQLMARRGARTLVNRAGAALVALADVASEAPADSRIWLESAEEMSTVAGRPLSELNHVGADSWIIFLVDPERGLRYVRVVSPDGEIIGRVTTSLNDLERLYLPAPD